MQILISTKVTTTDLIAGMEASTSPPAREFYVGPVEILSGLLKCLITSIEIMGFRSRLWDLTVVRPVDKKVSFHTCNIVSSNIMLI